MPRMQILTRAEQELFESPPQFNHTQRKKFLEFPESLLKIALGFRDSEYRVLFLVSCGYFKCCKKFFSHTDFHQRDLEYVSHQLQTSIPLLREEHYPSRTRQRHQALILKYFGFNSFKKKEKSLLKTEVSCMARMYLKPRVIFDRCIDWLAQKRIQIPTLHAITDMIRNTLQHHKTSLSDDMHALLDDEKRTLLDALFSKEEEQHQYRITLLKKLSQSTKPSKVKECVEDFQQVHTLYHQISGLIDQLEMGQAAIRYYAGSVIKSQIFQMQQRKENDRYIHASAFIAHQYYRMQDNLVDIFLSVMASFHTSLAKERKELALEQQEQHNTQLNALMQELDNGVFNLITSIRHVAHDNGLNDTQKVSKIQKLLQEKRFRQADDIRADISAISDVSDETIFRLSEARSVRLQNRLSPILKSVTWQAEKQAQPLLQALDYFKEKNGVITDSAPTGFLNNAERKALYHSDGVLRVSLYKVFLFQHVATSIKSGDINVECSYKYRPLDHYLISQERWEKEKQALLERAALTDFQNPVTVLDALDTALYTEYNNVNNRVADNEYLSFAKDGKFKIKTPALDIRDTDPLQSYFPKRQYIALAEILETVNAHSSMLSAFTHWQQTHTSQLSPHTALMAGIIGLGCGIGVRKMARISSHVSESELSRTVNWRFTLENVREANDAVLMIMDKMALPNIYRKNGKKLHTASDGSKYVVLKESLHATGSFKYFGQEQGISVNSFIDERNFLWYSLIMSAATRESMGVIDGLMYNEVVKSDIHSTDTHGYSEAIFGLTHMLGISFAPRLKGLKNQQLYIFKHHDKEQRKDWSIQPDNYVNERLICQNWDDFLRLIATIKLKENTASDIFRRLNSYSRQHRLYQTVKAFGQIIKSLFILRYLDDLELRQAIEKQLNKVELANRFSRAVAVGNPRGFDQVEPDEQEIAESCNRLIKNCIICWNYLYLTNLLSKISEPLEKENLLAIISNHSIMTWAHVNLLGEYDFSDEKRQDSVGITPTKLNLAVQEHIQA